TCSLRRACSCCRGRAAERASAHVFVGEEAVVGFELLVLLHQPGRDIEELGILEILGADRGGTGRDLAHDLEARGEKLVIEIGKALSQDAERVVRTVGDEIGRLSQVSGFTTTTVFAKGMRSAGSPSGPLAIITAAPESTACCGHGAASTK